MQYYGVVIKPGTRIWEMEIINEEREKRCLQQASYSKLQVGRMHPILLAWAQSMKRDRN